MGARHAEQLQKRKDRGGRRDLSEMRVVQRNVVHVIGLTNNIAKAEVLRRPEFFGQYGKILRATVSKVPTKQTMEGSNQSIQVYSAYLTFERADDAHVAIQAVDGFAVDGHILRASFGTTKYCRKFLDGQACDRKECNFLHKFVDENGYDKGHEKGNDKNSERQHEKGQAKGTDKGKD